MNAIVAIANEGEPSSRTAHAENGGVRLALLRGFELRCDGTTVPLVMGCQRLVAFLALCERPLPRAHVAEMLWTDVPDRRAWACLRSSLCRLRGLRRRIVEQYDDHLRLSPDVVVDVREATRVAGDLVARTGSIAQTLDQRIFEGYLLPGWSDEWVLDERERHRQLGLHALELLCERLTEDGQFCRAVQAGLAAVQGDPLRESAHRALIGAYIAEGNLHEAIRQYDGFDRLIRRELGLRPSDRLEALIAALGW